MNEMSASAHAIMSVAHGEKVVQANSANASILSQHMQEVIEDMTQESQNIGSIIKTISSIADQTNLLALNASIEAARAGEHGRGFAVVADEVRHLAKGVQDSTRETSALVNRLLDKIENAVKVIASGHEQMNETVALSNAAVESFALISLAVSDISNMNKQIANAAKEQSIVTRHMDVNLINIGETINELVASGTVAHQASEDLNHQSAFLNEQVSRFQS